jgi:xylulose-5-phosphate/fructose-6-phosphate phosphoketolase
LSVGQIYLLDNPLLERSDIKPRLLGHWGTQWRWPEPAGV